MSSSHTVILEKEQVLKLEKFLKQSGQWSFEPFGYAYWRAQKAKNTIVAYHSKKVLLQGKRLEEEQEFLQNLLGKFDLFEEKQEITRSEEQFLPHSGIDESGKGDYFGALCVACVYTYKKTAQKLLDLGVCDSKAIKDDKKVLELAQKVKEVVGSSAYEVLCLEPQKYNQLYAKMNNLNTLLGWTHAQVLEDVLAKTPHNLAILDKFSITGSVDKQLQERAKNIKVIQRVRAENDIAVATASILARASFLESLQGLSKKYKMSFPKGATNPIVETGKKFVQSYGAEELEQVAKTHFKTTLKFID